MMWKESRKARGDVSILFNPYLLIIEVKLSHKYSWTQHWMGDSLNLMGVSIFVVNVYAPSDNHEREAYLRCFFTRLRYTAVRY